MVFERDYDVTNVRRRLDAATSELRSAMSNAASGPEARLAEVMVRQATQALALPTDGAFLLACLQHLAPTINSRSVYYYDWNTALEAFLDIFKEQVMPAVEKAIHAGACNDEVLKGRQNEVSFSGHRLAALQAGGLTIDDTFFILGDTFLPLVARGSRVLVLNGAALVLVSVDHKTAAHVTTAPVDIAPKDMLATSSLLEHAVRYTYYHRKKNGRILE